MNTAVFAESWRGIVPLKSTRADVDKILGKPTALDMVYMVGNISVRVMYARKPCESGLPSNWGNWNVPKDTVININVDANIPIEKLNIANFESFKWYTDDSDTSYYRLKKEGIEYSVRDGKVDYITYGPTEDDQKFLCKVNSPEIRY